MRCNATLLIFVLVTSFSALSCEATRRWRFAIPFPGRVEPSFPGEGTKKAFANVDKQEKIFDTKEVSRQEHKPKVVLGDNCNNNNNNNKQKKQKRSGIIVPVAPEEHELSPIEILDSCHMPWIL